MTTHRNRDVFGRRRGFIGPLGTIGLAGLIVCLGLLSGPTDALASKRAPKQFFGVSIGPGFGQADFPKLRPAGVGSARFMINWPRTEPTSGDFSWSATDHLVAGFSARGVRPFPYVFGSPRWLGLGNSSRPPTQTNQGRWAWRRFLQAAVERYGPNGTFWGHGTRGPSRYRQLCNCGTEPMPIRAWEIWNEPNLPHYFAPAPSAKKYAKLLRVASRAIRQKDPSAHIVLAGLVGTAKPTAWRFLARVYHVKGIKRTFDAVGLHPYPINVHQLRREMVKIRRVMKRHHDRRAATWITELGWGSEHPNHFDLNKGVAGQRRLLARSFKLLLEKRRAWRLRRDFWFTWRDPSPDGGGCGFCRTSGLLKYDGTPKPAYRAYRRFALSRSTKPWRSSGRSARGITASR